MEQGPDLLDALVSLVDTMVDDYDIIEFLHGLADRCVALLQVSEAGIMLAGPDGRLHYAASSAEQMRLMELFEIQIDEGPCLDAYRAGQSVISATPAEADRRWPQFAPHARSAGFESIAAVPLRLRDTRIGALNLFSASRTPLGADDMRFAQVLADVATIGILHQRALHDASLLTGQLTEALSSRVVIEQAKGIIGEHLGISVDDAFYVLRSFVRTKGRHLSECARDIVNGSLVPATLLGHE